jgi:hypothetical protein
MRESIPAESISKQATLVQKPNGSSALVIHFPDLKRVLPVFNDQIPNHPDIRQTKVGATYIHPEGAGVIF